MAAVGDVFSDYSNNLADDGTLDVKPAAGHEAVINNIYHEGDIELYWNDGANSFKFAEATGFGVFADYAFHVWNELYVTIKNVSGGAADFGYDGMYTKVA